jgi:L-alanine-DL-glutamate epimerase-like enolase superfamily enzyme
MALESLQSSVLAIPFKQAFKHASAERAQTQTLWVSARGRNGAIGYGEGCPRDYVTGETLQGALNFTELHRAEWIETIHDMQSLMQWVEGHPADIDANPAAWAAVELALLDCFGQEENCPVEALLGLEPLAGKFQYTAVLGDAPLQQFEKQLADYLQAGFRSFKIKLSGHATDHAKVAALKAKGVPPRQVRADANNLWRDVEMAIAHLQSLDFPFFALEEPVQAGDIPSMRRLSKTLGTKIILDESLLRSEQLPTFSEQPQQPVVNLRVSKMGGVLRSLQFAQSARACGLQIIVGAHVGETSVLTRAALTVAHSTAQVLLAQEGAFGTHLLAHDVCEPPLMFGSGGVLDTDPLGFASRPGWGLSMALDAPLFNASPT